MVLYISYGQRQ